MITSAGPGEGKSTLAANLSITATRHGKRTILIDGDLRKPILHEIFGVPISPGLTNLVAEANQAWPYTAEYEAVASAEKRAEESSERTVTKWKRLSIREAIVSFIGNVLQITSTTNLRILTKGDPIMDPDVLWASPMIDEVLKILKQTADFIVIDTPPVIGIPDAGLIALHSDGIVLCVEAEQTERKMLLRTQKILDHASSKFWGAVLNKVDPTSLYGSYKYYKYYKKHYNKSHIRGRSQA
jgi:Mrp family chromosome partitioning ATPase